MFGRREDNHFIIVGAIFIDAFDLKQTKAIKLGILAARLFGW